MVNCVSTECGTISTIDKHDMHCIYSTQLSLINDNDNENNKDYTDKWQISYPSTKSSTTDSSLFGQFVYIEIKTSIDNSLLIEPLIRESCDYSFKTDLQFKSQISPLDNTQMIYTVILPSCNIYAIEICTYYIIIEASNQFIEKKDNKTKKYIANYEITASLGILLQFQQKYSYSQSQDNTDTNSDNTDTNTNNNDEQVNIDDVGIEQLNKLNQENENDIKNITCIYKQFYGLKASLTDFPIGIIIQPEFIDTDASFTIHQYTSAPDTVINENIINKLKGMYMYLSLHSNVT